MQSVWYLSCHTLWQDKCHHCKSGLNEKLGWRWLGHSREETENTHFQCLLSNNKQTDRHTHTAPHTLCCLMSLICVTINKLALLFFTPLILLLTPSCFYSFLAFFYPGVPFVSRHPPPSLSLCLFCSLSVQQGHWNPLQNKEPLRISTTFQQTV